jgi:hypothetical protein
MPMFYCYLPPHFDALTAILSNGYGYVLYYDEQRFCACIKQVLLLYIFKLAEHCRFPNIAKKLYLMSEILAT